MSSGGPPEPQPLPSGYHPGDRVRIREGMFAGMVGVVLGPPADQQRPAVLTRLRIFNRDVDVDVMTFLLEPAPPG